MKITALVAAVSLALGGTLLAGCDKGGDKAASGGSSASGGASSSGKGGSSGPAPSEAPKKPASPGGSPSGSK